MKNRLRVWLFALLTCFALVGTSQAAIADQRLPGDEETFAFVYCNTNPVTNYQYLSYKTNGVQYPSGTDIEIIIFIEDQAGQTMVNDELIRTTSSTGSWGTTTYTSDSFLNGGTMTMNVLVYSEGGSYLGGATGRCTFAVR